MSVAPVKDWTISSSRCPSLSTRGTRAKNQLNGLKLSSRTCRATTATHALLNSEDVPVTADNWTRKLIAPQS